MLSTYRSPKKSGAESSHNGSEARDGGGDKAVVHFDLRHDGGRDDVEGGVRGGDGDGEVV